MPPRKDLPAIYVTVIHQRTLAAEAQVKLIGPGEEQTEREDTAGHLGRAMFYNLQPGDYIVRATHDGTTGETSVSLGYRDEFSILNLDLGNSDQS